MKFIVLQEDKDIKLSIFLRRQGISSAFIKTVKYLQDGLLVNGQRAKTNQIVHINDKVEFLLPEDEISEVIPEDIEIPVLYRCQHFLALDKPMGMVMHPTRTHKAGTLANAYIGLMQKENTVKSFRSVGRLDAGTSGAVICANNQFAAAFLAQNMKKAYIALVGGCLPLGVGEINQPLGNSDASVIEQVVRLDGKPSHTCYETIANSPEASLVLVRPTTGRTHQIRVHFAWLGHPLVGDTLYGGCVTEDGYHLLHCAQINLTMATGEEKEVFSPIPLKFKTEAESRFISVDWQQAEKMLQDSFKSGNRKEC